MICRDSKNHRMWNLVYNGILILLLPLFLICGLVAVFLSPKRRENFFQRMGLQTQTAPLRPKARPIWIHALSVGETHAAVPLVESLARKAPGQPIVFSVSTVTGMRTATELLRNKAIRPFYFPFDFPSICRRTLKRVNPRLVVLVESDIWPNFLYAASRARIEVVLANARLSPRSYKGYRRFSFFMTPVFSLFSLILAQSREERDRFAALGVPPQNIAVAGNLKYDRPPPTIPPEKARRIRKKVGIREEALLPSCGKHPQR